jgi:hypothetical protein
MSINSNRFAIVEIHADSAGREAVPGNAVFVGSRSSVMERILDSRTRKACLELLNDAAHAEGRLESIREREQAVAAREDSLGKMEESVTRTLLEDVNRKLDSLVARMDSLEAEEKANNEEPITLPPGFTNDTVIDEINEHGFDDEGELQSLKGPVVLDPELDDDDDIDVGVLPQV